MPARWDAHWNENIRHESLAPVFTKVSKETNERCGGGGGVGGAMKRGQWSIDAKPISHEQNWATASPERFASSSLSKLSARGSKGPVTTYLPPEICQTYGSRAPSRSGPPAYALPEKFSRRNRADGVHAQHGRF